VHVDDGEFQREWAPDLARQGRRSDRADVDRHGSSGSWRHMARPYRCSAVMVMSIDVECAGLEQRAHGKGLDVALLEETAWRVASRRAADRSMAGREPCPF